MQATAFRPSNRPLGREEAIRKIKIVMLVPAIVICCAIMFVAS